MAAIDIAGMKSAFGYKPEDEEEAKPAAPETGVIDIAGMKQYFSAMPTKEKPVAPMFGVQFAPEKAAKVSQAAKKFLAEQLSLGQVAAETGAGLASIADVIAGVVPMVAGTGAYAVGRALQQTPEEATKLQQAVEAPLSQPVGRLFGVTEQPGYQQSAANRLMQFVGENLEKGAGYIAQQTGLPQADVQNMINSLSFVAPQAVKGAAGAVKGGVERVAAMAPEISPEAQAAFTAAPEVAALRRGELTPEQALEQFRAAGGRVPSTEAMPETMRVIGGLEVPAQAPTPAGAPVSLLPGQPPSAGAAAVAQRPFSLTGEESARGVFPQIKLHKIGEPIPVEEQNLRATIAREIMGDQGIRTSTITGDENLLRNEIERSKLLDDSGKLTPEAEVMRAQLASEQNALSRYAEQRVAATGADPTLPDDYARGERTNDTFFGEDGVFKQIREQKRSIYDEARANVGDNPVDTPTVDKLLSSRQFKAKLKAKQLRDFTDGLQELLDLHRTEGFEGTLPNSIASLEELRKATNELWDKNNSQFVKRVVDAIDEDIAIAGGPGLYQKARAVHQAEKSLFDVPGFKRIFGEFDANEIKTGVPLERMMKEINRLPFQEWAHIHDLLDTMSKGSMPGNLRGLQMTPELQAYANSALAEMKGSLARDIYQAGAAKVGEWNSNAANTRMNNYDRKLRYSLDPEEYTRYHVLNVGGQMMPSVPYEGAGRQTRRIEAVSDKVSEAARRAAQLTEAAAGTKGVYTFGIPQRAAEFLATTRAKESRAKSAAELQRELQQNVQKGQTRLSDMVPGQRNP